MRSWTLLLGGGIIWAAHFFACYAIASIFLTTSLARILVLFVTLLCLGACAYWWRRLWIGGHAGLTDDWVRKVALWNMGLSAVAIIWQAMPAVFA